MGDVIRSICSRVADLFHPALHVINPSRGESYPILSLYGSEGEEVPRLVFFPGWEDNAASKKRRLGFARQTTLLSRIHDAGVRGEEVEEKAGEPATPGRLSLATTAQGMDGIVHDLTTFLSDRVRVTVMTVPSRRSRKGWPDLKVVYLYSPFDDENPRLVLFPAWSGMAERASERIETLHQDMLLREMERRGSKPEDVLSDYSPES
jgi:hypothetical protein